MEPPANPGRFSRTECDGHQLHANGRAYERVTLADGRAIIADLVIAANGRSSLARRFLPLEVLRAPMDVFWFRIGKAGNSSDVLRGSIETGRMVVLIDRASYWQVAFLVPKGGSEAVKSRGIEWIAGEVADAFPDLTFLPNALNSPDDLPLLPSRSVG